MFLYFRFQGTIIGAVGTVNSKLQHAIGRFIDISSVIVHVRVFVRLDSALHFYISSQFLSRRLDIGRIDDFF